MPVVRVSTSIDFPPSRQGLKASSSDYFHLRASRRVRDGARLHPVSLRPDHQDRNRVRVEEGSSPSTLAVHSSLRQSAAKCNIS